LADARYRSTYIPPVAGAPEASEKLNDLGSRLKSLLEQLSDDLLVAETALKEERKKMVRMLFWNIS